MTTEQKPFDKSRIKFVYQDGTEVIGGRSAKRGSIAELREAVARAIDPTAFEPLTPSELQDDPQNARAVAVFRKNVAHTKADAAIKAVRDYLIDKNNAAHPWTDKEAAISDFLLSSLERETE